MGIQINTINLLAERKESEAIVALSEALPTADSKSMARIVRVLLERGDSAGLAALVMHFGDLPMAEKQTVVGHLEKLGPALRGAAQQYESRGPANVIAMIRQTRAVHLVQLAGDLLVDGPPRIRKDAACALLEMAQWFTSVRPGAGAGDQVCDAGAVLAMRPVVDGAVKRFDAHRQQQALLALAALGPHMSDVTIQRLRQRGNLATDGLCQILREPHHPAVRRSLLSFLRLPPLLQSVREGLRWIGTRGGVGDVMRCSHLLVSHGARQTLVSLKDPQRLIPAENELANMRDVRSRGVARWIVSLPLEVDQKIHELGKLKSLSDRLSRLSALRALMDLSAHDEVSQFCGDDDPAIARIALRYLIFDGWNGLPKLLPTLANSEHAEVRQIALEALGPTVFDRFWTNWCELDSDQQSPAGRAMIKIDPQFHRRLADRLSSPSRSDRLRAMSIIHGLNQGALFEEALIVLTQHDEERVVSSAVRALGSADSPNAVDAVERMLEHDDSRVRANAIEALEQMNSTRHIQKLLDMAQEEDNRPRANAIMALVNLRTEEAMAALSQMLNDYRPRQRISALWLVETLGLLDVARSVAELSITDPDGDVRRRAGGVMRYLVTSLDPDEQAETEVASGEATG